MAGEFDPLSGYADESALRKQTDFFLSLFDEIESKGLETAKRLQASFSLFDNKGTGTKQMIDDLKGLQLTSSNYAKVLAAVAAEMDNLTEKQKEQLKSINERFKAEEQLRAGAAESVKLIKTEVGQLEKLEAGRTALAQTIANNAEQIRQEKLERTRLAAVLTAENDSLQKSQAIIDLLINKKKKLNLETEQGARVNEAFNKAIEKEKNFILANADAETKRIKNIGNYAGSAKIIVDAMEKAREKVSQVTKEFGPLSPEAAAVTREFEGLKRITDQPQFLNISAKIGDTRAEMRFFVQQLNQLEDAGLKNSAVYKDLQARLAHLTDQLADTRSEVKALSSDTRGFDLFASSVGFAADAMQTAAGASQLFGASEKDAAKATATLVAIQSVANGVKSIATQLTTKGTAANIAYSFVQKQVSIAMDSTVKAAGRLKAALLTTGIGALIVGIGLLISKLNIFGSSSDDAAEATERLNKQLEAQRKAIDDLNESLEFAGKIREERLKQQSAAEIKLYANELITKEAQLRNLEKQETDSYQRRKDAVIEFQNDMHKAYELAKRFGGGSLTLDDNDAKKVLDRYEVYQNDLAESTKKRVNKEREIELFKEQFKTKLHEDAVKKQDDLDKKAAADRKKRAEQELKDALELEKRKAKALLDIIKANLNEEIRQKELIAGNDDAGLEAKLTAAREISKAQRALAAIDYNEAIADEVKIEEGKRVVVKKSNEELLLAQTNYINKIAELNDDLIARNAAIRKADIEKQKQEREDLKKAIYDANEQGANNAANINSIKRNQALFALDKQFQEGKLKSTEDYEKKRQKINDKYDRLEIENELDAAEEKLAIAVFFGDNTLEIEKTITDLKLQLLGKEVEATKKAAEEKLKIEQELKDKKIELVNAGKDLLISIVDGQFEKQKNQIAELIQLNDDQKNAEIKRITESTDAEAVKAEKIAIINAQAQAHKEALEKRARELDYQKAQFDRIVAIGDIIANTAKAVTKDLAGNKGLIPFDLAIGALQLAAVLARPLPRFKDGLFTDYEGLAITGDGGKREAIIKRDGKIMITPARDTVTKIDRGDRIHPDADGLMAALLDGALVDTARASRNGMAVDQYGNLQITGLEKQLQANAAQIVSAIQNKKELHLNASKDSLVAMWKHGASSISFVQDNTNWQQSTII